MSVAQRGKKVQWPEAAGPSVSVRGQRGYHSSLQAAAAHEAALRWLENRDAGRSVAWFRRLARAVWNRCNHINAPVVFPWSPSRRAEGLPYEFHRFAAAMARRHFGQGFVRLWLWAKACAWPVLAVAAIGPLVWRCGRRVRDLHGLSLMAQARDALATALQHGVFPTEYYHHRVFRAPLERDRAWYLHERELHALLRESARGLDVARVNDVARFMAECRAFGLPVPRTPAVFHHGRPVEATDATAGVLPQRDLFLRPACWRDGNMGQHWRWNAQTKTWSFRGETRAAAALWEHVARLSASRSWLVHESVSNHPDIARFSAGGVCSAQIATGLDEAGEPQILFAALHLPASAEGGWGPAPGELVAGIEVATGRLDVAMDEFVSDGEFSVHPASGVMIEDAIVPQWAALCDLARRAHRKFGDLPFVGWRIALSGGGPLLLEANTDWGVFRHVWPAETVFGSWCRRRLAALKEL